MKLLTIFLTLITLVINKLQIKEDEYRKPLKNCLNRISHLNNETNLKLCIVTKSIDYNLCPSDTIIKTINQDLIQFNYEKPNWYLIIANNYRIRTILNDLSKSTIWNPRAKFVIVSNYNPINVFNILNEYFVFNAIFLQENLTTGVTTFTYSPFINQSIDCGICQQFSDDFNFNIKFPKNWNRTNLKIGLLHMPFYISTNTSRLSGIEISILKIIEKKMNFHAEFLSNSYKTWGKYKDGSYRELYLDLFNKNVDVGMGMMHSDEHSIIDFDFTFPYLEDWFVWVVPKAQQDFLPFRDQGFSFTTFFQLTVYVFIPALVIHLFAKIIRDPCYQSISHCFLEIYRIFLGLPTFKTPNRISVRFVFALYRFFSLISVTAFQVNLYNKLSTISYTRQISTIYEIIESGLDFGYFDEVRELYHYNTTIIDQIIHDNRKKCQLNYDCLARVAFQRDFACVGLKRPLEYSISKLFLDKNGRPLLYPLKDAIKTSFINMAFRKGHPMYGEINKLLIWMKSSGLIDYEYKKAYKEVSFNDPLFQLVPLKWHKLEQFFGCLVCCLLVASMIFFIEQFCFLWHKYTK